MVREFERYATAPVNEVRIDYQVDPSDYSVTIRHQYRHDGEPVTTLAGLQPLHWKHSKQARASSPVRGPRGVTRSARPPSVAYLSQAGGVLPAFPAGIGDADSKRRTGQVQETLAGAV